MAHELHLALQDGSAATARSQLLHPWGLSSMGRERAANTLWAGLCQFVAAFLMTSSFSLSSGWEWAPRVEEQSSAPLLQSACGHGVILLGGDNDGCVFGCAEGGGLPNQQRGR